MANIIHTNRSLTLSRRALLRGAGAALALPWLEAMTPRSRGAENTRGPKRLAVLFMPNGVRQDRWTPEGVGRDFKLSPILEPLDSLKGDVLPLSNLWNQASNVGDGHYVKTSGFLTCATISKSLGFDVNSNGISMDQLVAQRLGRATPIPSLELAIDPVSVGVDTNVGYTRVYGSHIAWSRPTRPLAREINPKIVFERLFRATQPNQDLTRRDSLLLDRVFGDAKRLRSRLGSVDQSRLDDYLESVRALERRVEQAAGDGENAWEPADSIDPATQPDGIPGSHLEHVQLMLDLIALAFRTDTTRVTTFMFGNAVSGKSFSFLDGVRGGHHNLSHHENDEDKLRQYERIAKWHIEQYAYLLNQLREIKEGESNVLDNSLILFGSGLRDGNSHSPHNLPLVLAGRAGGRVESGRHLSFTRDTPLANLYVSMLNALDVPTERFADSDGPLPGVLNG